MKIKTTRNIIHDVREQSNKLSKEDFSKSIDKKWVAIDDLISRLEDWNNINGLDLHKVIKNIKLLEKKE